MASPFLKVRWSALLLLGVLVAFVLWALQGPSQKESEQNTIAAPRATHVRVDYHSVAGDASVDALRTAVGLAVFVVDASTDAPLAAVSVVAGSESLTTDANGCARVISDAAIATCRRSGYQPALAALPQTRSSDSVVRVAMRIASRVEGIVRSEAGRPIAGAVVSLAANGVANIGSIAGEGVWAAQSGSTCYRLHAVSDEHGRYMFEEAAPGWHSIFAKAEGFLLIVPTADGPVEAMQTIVPMHGAHTVDIVMQPIYRAEVLVLNKTPLTDRIAKNMLRVEFMRPTWMGEVPVYFDAPTVLGKKVHVSGEWCITDVAVHVGAREDNDLIEGSCKILAAEPQILPVSWVAASCDTSAEHTIYKLEMECDVGEVAIDTDVLASLELLSDGKVTAQFVGGDMNGWREVLAVPVGDYVLRTALSAAPKQEQSVSIRVSKGARATATLRARSGVGSVRVRVDDAGGQPFSKFVAHLLREDMRVFAYPVLGDPRVIIDCDPGSYRVEVYDLLGRNLGTESISVLPGRAVDLGFSLNL